MANGKRKLRLRQVNIVRGKLYRRGRQLDASVSPRPGTRPAERDLPPRTANSAHCKSPFSLVSGLLPPKEPLQTHKPYQLLHRLVQYPLYSVRQN